MIYKQLGVSDDTILSRLGFDPDEEKRKSEEEDQVDMQKQQQKIALGLVPNPQLAQPAQQQGGKPA